MKQILLRLNEERSQFIMDWTKDFKGVQNTDRLNHMLDKVPVLMASNFSLADENRQLEEDNKQLSETNNRYRDDLEQIKNAIDTLKNFKGITI